MMLGLKTTLILACFAVACSAQAQNSSLKQTATVVAACTISTTQNLSFGILNPLDPQILTAQGGLSLDCTKGAYTVSVNGGSNVPVSLWYNSTYVGGTTGNLYYYKCDRVMTAPGKASTLRYDLYTTSNGTTPVYSEFTVPTTNNPQDCGPRNFTFATITFTQPGAQQLPVYAKLSNLPARTLSAGNYSDTLNFTITF